VSSRVIRDGGARWPELAVRAYRDDAPGGSLDVTRRRLLSVADGDDALAFELRFFEVAPGGTSSLEHHEHPHAVVVLTGRGTVRLGAERHEIEPFDVVYVAPGEVHRFEASRGESLGFLCVVDSERDRPVPVDEP